MLWKLVEICLLKAGPQDLPAAPQFLALTLIGYLLVDVLVTRVSFAGAQALLISLLDMALLTALAHISLRIRAKPERFRQTLAALAGTGQLLGLLALPIIQGLSLAHAADTPAPALAWLWLGILIWSLLVLGHILRHALDVTLPIGVGVGVLYSLLTIIVVRALFPEAG